MTQTTVKIQLNDIIEINAPSNEKLDKKQFLVIYSSELQIKLVEVETLEETNLIINEEGMLMDTSISSISLLSRDITPSYALQNNLLKDTWIDITFSGDIPTIITGQITNLEEDMIEIKTYPSNSVIYIDFAYKGLPEELNIKEIVIRNPPRDVELETESKISIQEEETKLSKEKEGKELEEVEVRPEEETPVELDETSEKYDTKEDIDQEKQDMTMEDSDLFLDGLILEGDEISFGDELGEITQEVVVEEKKRRYSLEAQTTDLMDDMLSYIPTKERDNQVLKDIQTQINRYIELREQFSIFDMNGNVDTAKYKGINNKPLKDSLLNLNHSLSWIIPVVKNKRKMYDIELFDEIPDRDEMSIEHAKLGDVNIEENEHNKQYSSLKGSSFSGENERYKYLIRNLNEFYTPFKNSQNSNSIIESLPTKNEILTILDNEESYESFVIKNKVLEKNKYVMQKYNTGLHTIRKDRLKKNYPVHLSDNDRMNISSFIMLTENVMKHTKGTLPRTSILKRSSINKYPLFYYKLLNDKTAPNTIILDNYQQNSKNPIKFLSSINEFVLQQGDDIEKKYEYFLDRMIPGIRNLFLYVKEFLKDGLSISSVIKELEPFLIYEDDITYMQYNEISKYIKLKIIDYKKNYVLKSKEFRFLPVRNEKLMVNQLVSLLHNVAHPVNENELDGYIFEKIYKVNPTDTVCNIIHQLSIDGNTLISKSIAYTNLSLLGMIDIESEFKLLNEQYEETLNNEKENNNCGTFVLAKKYIDYDEMMDDNDKEIYFDKKYDTTVYDIIDEYKTEEAAMSKEEFSVFLIDKLKKNIGLSAEKAVEDAEAMILRKRPVKEGFYAMLTIDDDEEEFTFYRRANNKWERDDTMKSIYVENSQAFCNVQKDCLEVNNICSNNDLAETEIKKNAIKYILNEFDKKLDLSIEELKERLVLDLQKAESNVSVFKQQQLFNLLKTNNYHFSIGTKSKEVTQEISPHERLRDLILGHNDFSEKQEYIILFVKNYTRESIHGEDMYWLYCKDTNVKLMPTFFYKLACGHNEGKYLNVMADICKNQGEKSDDESWWVDKYTGYQIRPINFSTDEGYDEAGYAIKTREILEEEKDILPVEKENEDEENPIIITINNIITSISQNMKIFIEGYRKDITSVVFALLPKIINETIYSKLLAVAEKKQKKIASYENIVNKTIIILTLALIHISIQISIPPIKTRHTFPRCFRSFSGYPLDGDGSLSGIEYIACIASQMGTGVAPWNSIKKMKQSAIVKEIKMYIDKHIIELPHIIELMDEKLKYLTLPENKKIPTELNISNWNTFLPPLKTIELSKISNITENFKESLKSNMKSGSQEQHQQVLTLLSKASLLSMEIVKLVGKVVAEKTPILTNKLLEPFLENSCCHDGLVNSYEYFANENSSIEENNIYVLTIEYILYDYHNFHRAPLILDYRNTRLPITVFNEYTEEYIYKSIIHFCNLDNDLPIPEELLIFFTEKPEKISELKSLGEKIEELKGMGKNFNEESLFQLMTIIFKKNMIEIPDIQYTSNIDRIQDLLSGARDDLELDIPDVFIQHLETVLADYDTPMYQDTKSLLDFKDYLYSTSTSMHEQISIYLNRNSSYSRLLISNVVEFINTIHIWKPLNEDVNNTDKDVYRILEFIKDASNKISKLFPEMIKNKSSYENINIPNHWNLSLSHKNDMESVIKEYYSKINKYLGNRNLIKIFKEVNKCLSYWNKFLIEIQCISGIYSGNPDSEQYYRYKLFNKNTCLLIYRYILFNIINKILQSVQETEFLFLEGKKEPEDTTTDAELESQFLRLEEVDFTATNIDTNKQMISNYIIDVCLILTTTKKKILNFSHTDIIKNVSKEKEKEKKFEFTDKLANMKDDEREINMLMKNHKLGDWGKGIEKGLTQYVQDNFDKEREDREKRIMLELKLDPNGENMDNINILALDYEDEQRNIQEIENDVFGLQGIPEDDDAGEFDDNDWHGGSD